MRGVTVLEGCWLWDGGEVPRKKTRLVSGRIDYVRATPARHVWLQAGKPSDRRIVGQSCGNSWCVCPAHQITHRSRFSPPREPRAIKRRLMSAEVARAIRRRYLDKVRELAAQGGRTQPERRWLASRGGYGMRPFFAALASEYDLGVSSVRHAAYDSRAGV